MLPDSDTPITDPLKEYYRRLAPTGRIPGNQGQEDGYDDSDLPRRYPVGIGNDSRGRREVCWNNVACPLLQGFIIRDQSHEYSRELINAEYSKYIQTTRLNPSAKARI